MKRILMAAVLAGMAGAAYAADFAALQTVKASDIKMMTQVVAESAAPVYGSKGTGKMDILQKSVVRGNGVYNGQIQFIDWGVNDSAFKPTGTIVISGPVAKAFYDTMVNATYRPAPANMAMLTPSEISRDICEARVSRQMTCLKIPVFSADGNSLVLSGGKPVYNETSYQCDINIPDVTTMDFN